MKRIVIPFLCILFLLFSGCGKNGEENESQFIVSGGGKQGQNETKVLTLSMRVPETLNPLRNRDETVDTILKLVFQPLIDFDESGRGNPSVAESWAISPDGKTVALQLKGNILWHNGMGLTADDVIFSLESIKGAAEDSVYKDVLQYISGYEKTGTYTLNIHFYENYSGNLSVLRFPIIPAFYYQGQTDMGSQANMNPMGSGPYQLLSQKWATEILLEANANYWAGEPLTKNILVKVTAEEETDIYAFEQGMIDVLVTSALQAGKYADAGISGIHQFISEEYDFIGFNFRNPLFQDKNMRQVVAYALPKKSIFESIYLQYARITNTPVSPKSWLYEENVVPYEYDTSMAATLLKNAGWADANGDGRLEKEGQGLQVTILVNEENAARKQVANKLKEELILLGFEVIVDAQPFAAYEEKFKSGQFDLVVGGWKMSPVTDLASFFGTGGRMNYTGYTDQQTDELLAAANEAVGEGKMLLAYSSLQKRLADELPYISIAYRNDAVFVSNRIGGEIQPSADNVFRTVNRWTFDENK